MFAIRPVSLIVRSMGTAMPRVIGGASVKMSELYRFNPELSLQVNVWNF
jgi:hypothetical protein